MPMAFLRIPQTAYQTEALAAGDSSLYLLLNAPKPRPIFCLSQLLANLAFQAVVNPVVEIGSDSVELFPAALEPVVANRV